MPREILFEMKQIGNIMRVTAIDVDTGTEVVMQGSAKASALELQTVAAKKLLYVMNKKKD